MRSIIDRESNPPKDEVDMGRAINTNRVILGCLSALLWTSCNLNDAGLVTTIKQTGDFPVTEASLRATTPSVLDENADGSETVALDASDSTVPDGQEVTYEFSEDGVVLASGTSPIRIQLLSLGVHTIHLDILNSDGDILDSTEKNLSIVAANTDSGDSGGDDEGDSGSGGDSGGDTGGDSGGDTSGPLTTGWTDLVPASDSRIIYVSSSSGSNSNSGLSEAAPVATITKGLSLMRDGYPDWIRLKAGDTFTEAFGRIRKSGRSSSEPMVYTSYGTGARPVLKTNGGYYAFGKMDDAENFIAITNLDFYANKRDPANAEFDVTSQASGFYWLGAGGDVLIENCKFRYLQLVIQEHGGARPSGFKLRRNMIYGSYNVSGVAHAQGLYAVADNILLEENIWDHNGWHATVSGAYPTMFNHNNYISESNNITVKNNLYLRPSSMGIKYRADHYRATTNITTEGNFFFDGELGISIGGNVTLDERFYNVRIRDNVFHQIGRSNPTGRDFHWGIEIRDNVDALFTGNLFSMMNYFSNSYGINVKDSEKDLTIDGNQFVHTNGGLIVSSGSPRVNVSIGSNPSSTPSNPRTLETYLTSIGETGGLDGFFTLLGEQRREVWREDLMAHKINAYLRGE